MDNMNYNAGNGIEITAEIHLRGTKNSFFKITSTLSPNVATLLRQIDALIVRVQARTHVMMLQEYTKKLIEISDSGVFPQYGENDSNTIRAYIFIYFGCYIVEDFCSNEVFLAPENLTATNIFERETIERTKKAIAIHVLSVFSEQGGH